MLRGLLARSTAHPRPARPCPHLKVCRSFHCWTPTPSCLCLCPCPSLCPRPCPSILPNTYQILFPNLCPKTGGPARHLGHTRRHLKVCWMAAEPPHHLGRYPIQSPKSSSREMMMTTSCTLRGSMPAPSCPCPCLCLYLCTLPIA